MYSKQLTRKEVVATAEALLPDKNATFLYEAGLICLELDGKVLVKVEEGRDLMLTVEQARAFALELRKSANKVAKRKRL